MTSASEFEVSSDGGLGYEEDDLSTDDVLPLDDIKSPSKKSCANNVQEVQIKDAIKTKEAANVDKVPKQQLEDVKQNVSEEKFSYGEYKLFPDKDDKCFSTYATLFGQPGFIYPFIYDDNPTAWGIKNTLDGNVSNIPDSMITNQYGMAGLVSCLRSAKTDPHLTILSLGEDLTTYGIDMNAKEPVFFNFNGPYTNAPPTESILENLWNTPTDKNVDSDVQQENDSDGICDSIYDGISDFNDDNLPFHYLSSSTPTPRSTYSSDTFSVTSLSLPSLFSQ